MTISPESPSLERVQENGSRVAVDASPRFSPSFERAPARGVCELELAAPQEDSAHADERGEAWCTPGVYRA
jgi:hypothetical protein